MVGRAGLIRPLASPYGQRYALSYRCAMLEPERRVSPTRFVRYVIFKLGKVLRYSKKWWVVRD
ncbi:Uncharacterised protein [Serratia grimesii]|jgi:hypothetical protein|nr:Uncharacterised protein [Serratia grimesii]SMZ55596.1 Uncharacterised protein [Serratia grimesii]